MVCTLRWLCWLHCVRSNQRVYSDQPASHCGLLGNTPILILMTKPKWLRVINEVKWKRYKIIQKIYVFASFLVPIVFVPWPFISVQYGNQGDMCWLYDPSSCGDRSLSNIVNRLLMWYSWALLVWLYIVAVFAYTYCSHKRSTTR